jgi:hypothetical protein
VIHEAGGGVSGVELQMSIGGMPRAPEEGNASAGGRLYGEDAAARCANDGEPQG